VIATYFACTMLRGKIDAADIANASLLGGLAAIFISDGINKGTQLAGIGITVLVAIVAGFVVGKIIATAPYDDAE